MKYRVQGVEDEGKEGKYLKEDAEQRISHKSPNNQTDYLNK